MYLQNPPTGNQTAETKETTRLQQEAQDRHRELQTLLDVAAAAGSSLDLDEMLNTTLDRLVGLVDASRAGVMIINPESGELEPHIIRPEHAIDADDMAELLQACKVIVASGQPLYIAPDPEKGFLEPGAFYPLQQRERILGLVAIIGAEGERFSPGKLALFQSIASQLAVAVENARLYERAERTAAAAERSRLAQELHDSVTQTLFSASLIADVLPGIWEQDKEQGLQRLEELRELTQGALAEMRALLLELRPATLLESSLAELLQQLAQAIGGRSRLPVELIVKGERPLPPDAQVALYRIAQEALNNIIKHAAAGRVMIKLTFLPQDVHLSIHDDGRGFDISNVPRHSLGLGIMRDRAQKIGAELTVDSRIGEGTTVTVNYPTTAGSEVI